MSNPARARSILFTAGTLGLIGVGLGAMGAHAMAEPLAARGMTHAWETASRYHLFHALAVLAAGIWFKTATGAAAGRILWAVRLWTLGVLLFSGSLYGLALGGPRVLGPITPIGGVALMAGWVAVCAAALARDEKP